MTDTDIQSKLAEYEDMVRLLTAKCSELAAENVRLRSSENNAHSVLREVYNDPTASPNVRVLAARAAIGHESAPLKPVSQLELAAAEVIEPLADVVARQRARADKALAEDPQFEPWRNRRHLLGTGVSDGNGGSDSSSNDHS